MTLASTPTTSSTSSQSGNSSPSPKTGTQLPQSPLLKSQPLHSASPGITMSDGNCVNIKDIDATLLSKEEFNSLSNDEKISSIDLDLLTTIENTKFSGHEMNNDTEKSIRKKAKFHDYASSVPSKELELSSYLSTLGTSSISGHISISVSTLLGNIFTINDLSPDDGLDVLKMAIFEASGVFPENQLLLFQGKLLPTTISACSIKSLGIVNNSSLKLILSMSGGPGSFMIDSTSYKKQQEYLDDELYLSSYSSSFNIDEIFDQDSDELLTDSSDDFAATETYLEPVHSTISTTLPSKTLIYRTESGNIFVVEMSGIYTDISLLTFVKNDLPSSSGENSKSLTKASEGVDTNLENPIMPISLNTPALGSTCYICSKKVRQSLRYPCKCTFLFCPSHKPPHLHDCSYNYCDANKKELINSNPPIISSTLKNSQ